MAGHEAEPDALPIYHESQDVEVDREAESLVKKGTQLRTGEGDRTGNRQVGSCRCPRGLVYVS